jgi:cell division septal protein FtsQ
VGLCAGLGGGLWAGWQWFKMTSALALRTVTVQGNSLVSQEEILDKFTIVPGQSIYAYNRDVITQSLAGNPYIKACRVKRLVPSKLVICVIERSPVAYVNLEQLYLVDQDKVLLPIPRSGVAFDLPVITGLTLPARTGQVVVSAVCDTALAFLHAIFAICPEMVEKISEINVACPQNITLILTAPAIKVFLGPAVDKDNLQKLNIWERYDREATLGAEYIDLRFAGQIVVKRKTT